MFFFTNNKTFSLKTAELVGVYVHDYRMFHNQSFALNPKYEFFVEKENRIVVYLRQRNEYDAFRQSGLNVITICGPNGCGKSTLLDIVKDRKSLTNRNASFFLFVDKNGNFAATAKCSVKIGNKKNFRLEEKIQGYSQIFAEGDGLFEYSQDLFSKDFIKDYLRHPEIYQLYDEDNRCAGQMFTDFSIETSDELYDEFRNVILRNGLGLIDDVSFAYWFEDDPLIVLFLVQFQDNRENGLSFSSSELKKREHLTGVLELCKNKILGKKRARYDELNKKLKSFLYEEKERFYLEKRFQSKSYSIKQYDKVREKWQSVIESVENFIESYEMGKFFPIKDYFFFAPFKQYADDSRRYLHDFSDGERKFLECRFRLKYAFSNAVQKNSCFCCLDEPNNYLHPEWSRRFWKSVVESVTVIRNELNVDKFFSIFVTTHSPFLLSDMFSHNVIVLKDVSREKDKTRTVTVVESEPIFAENIGKLLYKNFSLKKTIGEIASDEIKNVSNNPNSENSRFIIEEVADPLLKRLLEDRIDCEKN